jgi:excisionase family DNA binding protein
MIANKTNLGYNKETKMDNGNGQFLTITEAARLIGVSAKTIVRWEKAGKVKRSKRDFRGWRVFDGKDLKKLKAFRETIFY